MQVTASDKVITLTIEYLKGQNAWEAKFLNVCPGSGNPEGIPVPLRSGDRIGIEVTFCRVQTQRLFLEQPKKAWSCLKIMMTQHLEASMM